MNMKALISTIEPRHGGYRVAQIVHDDQTFEVADVMFWQTCPDNIVADLYWFNPADSTFVEVPIQTASSQPVGNAPNVIA